MCVLIDQILCSCLQPDGNAGSLRPKGLPKVVELGGAIRSFSIIFLFSNNNI